MISDPEKEKIAKTIIRERAAKIASDYTKWMNEFLDNTYDDQKFDNDPSLKDFLLGAGAAHFSKVEVAMLASGRRGLGDKL